MNRNDAEVGDEWDDQRLPTAERADHLFLHSLLEQSHDVGAEKRNARLFASLDAPVARVVRRTWTSQGMIAAACACAIAVLAWVFTGPANQAVAMDVLDRAEAAAKLPVDRKYEVSVRFTGDADARPSATIWVRGGDKFVVRHPHPAGKGELWIGANGRDLWVVPAVRSAPVLSAVDSKWLQRWIEERRLRLPFLNIESVLNRLKSDYHISLTSEVVDATTDHLRGVRSGTPQLLPQTIDVWSDRRSGTVRRMELSWRQDDRTPHWLSSMEIRLVEEKAANDDWYEHQSHHDANRRVIENHAKIELPD
jgi:hypothetical protein